LVLALKHGDRAHLAAIMAVAMARVAVALPAAMLVQVPLHRWRLWRHGFNQAAVLAQALAKLAGADTDMMALQRVKATPPSQDMGRAARAANVRGAFRVTAGERIRGRDVVLVDDVLTTGATADAGARHMRRAGARSVHVLTYARVVRDGKVEAG
jgi:ComF family protein